MAQIDQKTLAANAYAALKRIRESKLEESKAHDIRTFKPKKHAQLFEEYTDSKFERKLKMDVQVYNQFLKGITEEQEVGIKNIMSSMLTTTQSIYEHINIEPKIYGFKQLTSDASDNELQLEAKRLLNEHFNKAYYSLTSGQKYEKYKDSVVQLTYEYITEDNLALEEATEHAYKTIIVENLLRTINFPFLVQAKLDELAESDMYAEMFDKDKLLDLTEQFDSQVRILSRVFATTI